MPDTLKTSEDSEESGFDGEIGFSTLFHSLKSSRSMLETLLFEKDDDANSVFKGNYPELMRRRSIVRNQIDNIVILLRELDTNSLPVDKAAELETELKRVRELDKKSLSFLPTLDELDARIKTAKANVPGKPFWSSSVSRGS